MPRTPRVDAPGAVHHVMVRGVDRAAIFADDVDRARFVDRLRQAAPEERARIYAWALMPNHVHLVLRAGPPGISRLMARIGTTHALAFNRRHGRVGHLFQDRFRSVLVESDVHLRWLLRYVHRNPIEAGLVGSVEALEDYPWAGHRELVDERTAPLVDRAAVLSWFAPRRADAIHALRRWMGSDEETAATTDESAGGREAPHRADAVDDPGRSRRLAEAAVIRAAATRGVDPADIWRGARSRDASGARARAIEELHDRHRLPLSEIERALGLSRGAAFRALRRARAFRHQTEPSPSSGG